MHEESDPVGQAVENLDDLWPPFTAVPPRRGRAPKSQRGPRGSALSRDEIVTTAVALADAEGAEAINMRHIAKELGVGTMSLYWHVGARSTCRTPCSMPSQVRTRSPRRAGSGRTTSPNS